MNNILTIILGTLGTTLTAVLAWGAERLIVWLNGKIKNEKSLAHLTNALDVVTSVVKEIYQTYVQNLKHTENWTEDTQTDALNEAIFTIERILSPETKAHLTTTHGNLRTYLISLVEAKIYDLKNGKAQ